MQLTFSRKINQEIDYQSEVNKRVYAYETIKNKTANAADDLLTTIEDYGKFLVAVMKEVLLV